MNDTPRTTFMQKVHAAEDGCTEERKQFEQWYATHAFDYERNPIGSRDCRLQWEAWQARAILAECNVAQPSREQTLSPYADGPSRESQAKKIAQLQAAIDCIKVFDRADGVWLQITMPNGDAGVLCMDRERIIATVALEWEEAARRLRSPKEET